MLLEHVKEPIGILNALGIQPSRGRRGCKDEEEDIEMPGPYHIVEFLSNLSTTTPYTRLNVRCIRAGQETSAKVIQRQKFDRDDSSRS
jgi:hypothetical protein